MIKYGERLGLALEPRNPLGIGRECVRKDFDSNSAFEPCVARFVDLTHAAGAKRREDFIGPEARTRGECHVYFVGTRRFSSSSKCWTTTICGGASVGSLAAFIIRNRCPSGAIS